MDVGDPNTLRAAAIHEELMAWLIATYPNESADVMLAAVTYEVGRLAGQLAVDLSEREQRAMANGIRDVMLDHMRAYRQGMRM